MMLGLNEELGLYSNIFYYVQRLEGILSRACAKHGLAIFSERGKLGSPSHKRGFCAVQQKESRHVCKILFKGGKIFT